MKEAFWGLWLKSPNSKRDYKDSTNKLKMEPNNQGGNVHASVWQVFGDVGGESTGGGGDHKGLEPPLPPGIIHPNSKKRLAW